jgi:CubicO group peptidase (beta-lactamase class C family)
MFGSNLTSKKLSVIPMRGVTRIFSVGAVVLVGLICPGSTLLAEQAPEFNASIFEKSIRNAIDGKVMGYSFVIADRKGIRTKISGGFAQSPKDDNLRMKTFIPSNVGSVAKVMTGIALLNLLEQRKVANLTVEWQLNTPMRFHLPDKWVRNYNDGKIGKITLRNLLNHRSGLAPEPSSGGSEGIKIALTLSKGANSDRTWQSRLQ